VSAASPSVVSFAEYLEAEAASESKHEWCAAVVYAMSRGTPEHARLTMRIARALGSALEPDCEIYSGDALLFVEAADLATYADASVVRGPLETKVVKKNGKSLGEAVTNPTIIVEVLSESTERYDRDGKFQAYKQLRSLREYVLVSQEERQIEVHRRGEGGVWSCDVGRGGDTVTIHGSTIAVDQVYGIS
jgi:Uma2 family endonuclease